MKSIAARAGDYNGDGLMDVAIANDRQQSRIYLGKKEGKFAPGPATQNTRNLDSLALCLRSYLPKPSRNFTGRNEGGYFLGLLRILHFGNAFCSSSI